MNKGWIVILLVVSGLAGLLISIYLHREPPPRSTDVQVIPVYHFPTLFVKQLAGDPEAGKKIFREYCFSCHSAQPVIDVHAPALGDQNAWAIRCKNKHALLKNAIEGIKAMPARGGCFECSDNQLWQVIEYFCD